VASRLASSRARRAACGASSRACFEIRAARSLAFTQPLVGSGFAQMVSERPPSDSKRLGVTAYTGLFASALSFSGDFFQSHQGINHCFFRKRIFVCTNLCKIGSLFVDGPQATISEKSKIKVS
jgi:hypothetical protein